MKLKLLSILVAASAATNAFAEDTKTWEVTSELGAIITSGNTETTTLKGGIKALHNLESWNNEYKINGLYKEDEMEESILIAINNDKAENEPLFLARGE